MTSPGTGAAPEGGPPSQHRPVGSPSDPTPAKAAHTLGLHPTVLLLAGTHFIVDGYSNIYAPLLPLLIPQLGLSLAAAGTLQMCFQMSNSVAQLGFGRLADHWRPRILVLIGPLVSVAILSLIGLASNVWMLGAVLVVGGLGGGRC